MKHMMTRLASVLLALLVVAGLIAPAAAAAPSQAVPAAAPALPASVPGALPSDGALGGWSCLGTLLPGVIGDAARRSCIAEVGAGARPDKTAKATASAAAKAVANSVLGEAATACAEFVRDILKTGLSWWLTTSSVQVKDSGVLGDPDSPEKSLSLHAVMVSIGAMIAVLLTMIAGIRTMIQRKGQPLAQVAQGLIINVLVSVLGVVVIDSLLIASDTLTKTILDVGFGGDDVSARMVALLVPQLVNPIGLLLIALIALLVGGVQVVLLFLRQAAVPIQALLLPIAGAGQLGGDSSRQWLPRLFTAIMVVVVYKPSVAFIIAVGYTEIENGNGYVDFIRGVVTLGLSIFALKGLLALFAPLGLAMGNAVSSGGGITGALSMAGAAMAANRGGGDGGSGGSGGAGGAGTSAAAHAAHMDRHGPASASNGASQTQDGDTAVRQASSSVPRQTGADQPDAAPAGAAAEGAQVQGATAGASASGGAQASRTAAAGGPVAISVVAAEAARGAANKSANTMSGRE